MAQEIDRTFLVQNDLQRQNATGFLVRQGFLFASLTFPFEPSTGEALDFGLPPDARWLSSVHPRTPPRGAPRRSHPAGGET
jgi:hypothetical protein